MSSCSRPHLPDFEFNDFDENVQATTFYTTGTTGLPKGVYYSHRQLVLHAMAELAVFGLAAKQGSFHRDDVYMPITPCSMFTRGASRGRRRSPA